MLISGSLLKKELRQNVLIYSLPYLILLVFQLMKLNQGFLTEEWAGILATIIPIAFGVAYGLQSFDLEENQQTKDFLLTKPLSRSQIIWSKYLTGLIVLLPLTILWQYVFAKQQVSWPVFANFGSFWLLASILTVILTYSGNFLAGIFIRGPFKLIGGIITSILLVCWFFSSWFEFLTFLMLNSSSTLNFGNYFLLFIITGGLSFFMLAIISFFSNLHLQNLPMSNFKNLIILGTILACLIPLGSRVINHLNQPTIRPFNSLITTLFDQETWFLAEEGSKHPQGELYAFRSNDGRLGIAAKGEKPQVVYANQQIANPVLSSLQWSPDGQKIAFYENGIIKIYNRVTQKTASTGKGNLAFWGTDSQVLLILRELTKQPNSFEYELANYNLATQKTTVKGKITTGSNFINWDPRKNHLLIADPQWFLKIFDFKNKQLHEVQLKRPDNSAETKKEVIFFARVLPPVAPQEPVLILVYAMHQKVMQQPKKHYNIYFYHYQGTAKALQPFFAFKQATFADFIARPGDQKFLARKLKGIYQEYTLPREVEL